MSIQAVGWVLDSSTTKGAHRLVMIALANHADERGQCWPSIKRIADEANITEDHAKRVLRDLEAEHHIAKKINAAPDERMRTDRRPNLYSLLDGGAQKSPPWQNGGDNDAVAGGGSAQSRGGADVPPNHQLEPSVQPKPKTQSAPEGADPVIEALCNELATRIAAHEQTAGKPIVTERWHKDMRLLVERGPLGRKPADPFPPERIMRALDVIFTRLNEPSGNPAFCWADQVQSPTALRKHLPKIALAAKRMTDASAGRNTRSLDKTVARLTGTPPPPSPRPLGLLEAAQ